MKNDRNLMAFSPYITMTGALPDMPLDSVEMNRFSSNTMMPIEIAIEKIVNIHESDMPLTVDSKSSRGIITSSMPATVFSDDMMGAIRKYIESVQNEYLKQLLKAFFVEDAQFIEDFRMSSAAKSVHHSFVGGLAEHTLGVTNLCHFFCRNYPYLKRDLLIAVSLLHDIGKTKELSRFPRNDYTEEGQFIGHIIIGVQMIDEKIKDIPGFPELLANEVRHCILAHHGELEYGSPKKPAIAEALALNFADNTDAKLEIFKEALATGQRDAGWIGYQGLLESNIRRTEI